jgi:hypothetical protein
MAALIGQDTENRDNFPLTGCLPAHRHTFPDSHHRLVILIDQRRLDAGDEGTKRLGAGVVAGALGDQQPVGDLAGRKGRLSLPEHVQRRRQDRTAPEPRIALVPLAGRYAANGVGRIE